MPRSIDELVEIFDLEFLDDCLYRARQPETSWQRVFGGQVLGQALLAAYRTVDDDRLAHSLHAYFLVPGDTAVPIIYDVERIRDGRSFSARRVSARQHGRSIFFLTVSFQIEEEGPDHQDTAPEVPSPESAPPVGGPDDAVAEEFSALQVRRAGPIGLTGESDPPGHPAVARVWMRTAGGLPDDPVLHRCVLAYMSDLTLLHASLVPHPDALAGGVQRASLDHAMWFHRPVRADGWLLYDQVSPSASGARGLSIGRIFDGEGRLAATAVQEGLIRPTRA